MMGDMGDMGDALMATDLGERIARIERTQEYGEQFVRDFVAETRAVHAQLKAEVVAVSTGVADLKVSDATILAGQTAIAADLASIRAQGSVVSFARDNPWPAAAILALLVLAYLAQGTIAETLTIDATTSGVKAGYTAQPKPAPVPANIDDGHSDAGTEPEDVRGYGLPVD